MTALASSVGQLYCSPMESGQGCELKAKNIYKKFASEACLSLPQHNSAPKMINSLQDNALKVVIQHKSGASSYYSIGIILFEIVIAHNVLG